MHIEFLDRESVSARAGNAFYPYSGQPGVRGRRLLLEWYGGGVRPRAKRVSETTLLYRLERVELDIGE